MAVFIVVAVVSIDSISAAAAHILPCNFWVLDLNTHKTIAKMLTNWMSKSSESLESRQNCAYECQIYININTPIAIEISSIFVMDLSLSVCVCVCVEIAFEFPFDLNVFWHFYQFTTARCCWLLAAALSVSRNEVDTMHPFTKHLFEYTIDLPVPSPSPPVSAPLCQPRSNLIRKRWCIKNGKRCISIGTF